jgi:hypothetical protein
MVAIRKLDAEAYETEREIVVEVHVGDLENTRFGRVHIVVANGVLELHVPYEEELRRVPLARREFHAEASPV